MKGGGCHVRWKTLRAIETSVTWLVLHVTKLLLCVPDSSLRHPLMFYKTMRHVTGMKYLWNKSNWSHLITSTQREWFLLKMKVFHNVFCFTLTKGWYSNRKVWTSHVYIFESNKTLVLVTCSPHLLIIIALVLFLIALVASWFIIINSFCLTYQGGVSDVQEPVTWDRGYWKQLGDKRKWV